MQLEKLCSSIVYMKSQVKDKCKLKKSNPSIYFLTTLSCNGSFHLCQDSYFSQNFIFNCNTEKESNRNSSFQKITNSLHFKTDYLCLKIIYNFKYGTDKKHPCITVLTKNIKYVVLEVKRL